jgi:hypothetical protein
MWLARPWICVVSSAWFSRRRSTWRRTMAGSSTVASQAWPALEEGGLERDGDRLRKRADPAA